MLNIIKPGQTGKGILIEHDAGYISPKDNPKFVNEVAKLSTGQSIIEEPLILTAVLQKCGVENRNGRVYPRELLVREDDRYQEVIKNKTALGESDHPDTSIIAVDRISHNILETWWDQNTLLGKLEIIMSPGFVNSGIISCQGDQVANLLRKGVTIGVSSRGVGTLAKENGKNVVQDDFEIICWDIVTSPSTPGAWMFTQEEQAKPFVENTIKNNDKLLVDNLKKFLGN